MKETAFWKQVSIRNRENHKITRGGFSPAFAPIAEKAGLHFWKIGLLLALIPALWLWINHYEQLMVVIRTLVWR